MGKNKLEQSIAEAAQKFALEVVGAVKSATLQELMDLHQERTRAKPGPKPKGLKTEEEAKPARKKRVVKNYPKCAFPGCENNRFPRGKGFCGEHWHQWEKGEIQDASTYK